ncbi:Y-family DNA polymerase [Paraburkholderia phytofirmans]|uniref:DNA polymerase Y family protein n=1 Tax=Paraburkholderia phytofirmans TaxID=261302 RepID=A0ABW9BGF5_9BURK
MRVLLAVHLPRLPLEIFRPRWLGESAHGCVVLEGDTVALLDRKAGAAGVRPGMRRGGVLTLVPDIELHERDMGREEETLHEVAVALMRFSPDVAVAAEATVLMDISASLRLFGGVAVLCREVRRVVDTMGVSARITAAPTGTGAWLLARASTRRLLKLASLERRLSALPFGTVPELRPFADWFTGIGCVSIADVRRLPRAGLQRRCGVEVLDCLDRAFGTAPELYEWLVLPPKFVARIELPDRVEDAEAVLFSAHRLIMQLCGWLAGRQLAVTALDVRLEHERGRAAIPPTAISIALAEPTWREHHLVRLLRERLSRTELAAAVIAVSIEATKVDTAVPASDQLFTEPGGTAEEHTRLVELLVARLGVENVLRAAPTADYRPEVANRWVPLGDAVRTDPLPLHMPRPAWLLDSPVQLMVRRHRPFYGSPLRKVSPPERIEAGWHDGQLITRDYFVVQADDGTCYWAYQERVSSRDEGDASWFLHGLFG